MRVLATVQSYFPFQERGGPVFKVGSIAHGLVNRGHKVKILTADLGLRPNNSPGEPAIIRCEWGWSSSDHGVETIYTFTFARYRALTVNPAVIGFSRNSLRGFDVVHIFGLYDLLGPIVAYFCRRYSIPYFIEPMGMYRPIVRNIKLKNLYHRILGNQITAGAQSIIATSEQEKLELLGSGIDESRVIVRRNGIEGPEALPARGEFRRKWQISAEAKVVLFLGRLVSKKSPDLLIQAYARWRAGKPLFQNSKLVFAGPDEGDGFVSKLKQLSNVLGVSENTMFVGPLYADEKWQAYRDADVFVLPSQNENFGNAAAESAICGTPIIVTDRCGIAPYVGTAGIVVPHDIAKLENALDRIVGDAQFHRACRGGCAEMANALSWKEPLDETERLYHECSSGGILQGALC